MITFIKSVNGDWINAAHILWIDGQGCAKLTNNNLVNLGPFWMSEAVTVGQVS